MLTHVHSLQRTQPRVLRNKPVIRFHPGAESQRQKIREILRGPVVQPKLKIGAPNDKYEQEADRVAEQVMRMPDPQLTSGDATSDLEEDQLEDEMIQTQPITPNYSSSISAYDDDNIHLNQINRWLFEYYEEANRLNVLSKQYIKFSRRGWKRQTRYYRNKIEKACKKLLETEGELVQHVRAVYSPTLRGALEVILGDALPSINSRIWGWSRPSHVRKISNLRRISTYIKQRIFPRSNPMQKFGSWWPSLHILKLAISTPLNYAKYSQFPEKGQLTSYLRESLFSSSDNPLVQVIRRDSLVRKWNNGPGALKPISVKDFMKRLVTHMRLSKSRNP